MSDEAGFYQIPLSAPGTYGLRALRVGFRPTIVTEIEVKLDTPSVRDIVLRDDPVVIAEVRVTERRECSGGLQAGRTLAFLWEQAQAALIANDAAERSGALDILVVSVPGHTDAVTYLADPGAGALKRARNWVPDTGRVREVIVSHVLGDAPVETLATRGYGHADQSGQYALDTPSADALLSDTFLEHYCLQLTTPPADHPAWLGIAFSPKKLRGALVDIQGTLWLDRRTSDLQRIEFTYVNLPTGELAVCDSSPDPRWQGYGKGPSCSTLKRDFDRLGLGGSADFVRLPSGDLLPARWTLHSWPDAQTWRPGGNRVRFTGPRESVKCTTERGCSDVWFAWPRLVTTDGVVTSVRARGVEIYHDSSAAGLVQASALRRAGARQATLTGRVLNSAGQPLANAVVQTEEPWRAVLTDADGLFSVTRLPAGRVTVEMRCRGYKAVRIPVVLDPEATRAVSVALEASPASRSPTSCTGMP